MFNSLINDNEFIQNQTVSNKFANFLIINFIIQNVSKFKKTSHYNNFPARQSLTTDRNGYLKNHSIKFQSCGECDHNLECEINVLINFF